MTEQEITQLLNETGRPWTNPFELAAWHSVLASWDPAEALAHMFTLHETKPAKDIGPPDFNPNIAAGGGKHAAADGAWAAICEQARHQGGLRQLRADLADDPRPEARALRALTHNDLVATETDTRWAYIRAYERAAHTTATSPALTTNGHPVPLTAITAPADAN